MIYRVCILFLLGYFGSISAFAHHSGATRYQTGKSMTLAGVVTEFKLINPHTLIYLQAKDVAGKPEAWVAEGEAAAVLRRRGWTGSEMKAGDTIKVIGHPSRDGSNTIEWESIVLPNGVEMDGGNEAIRDKSLEEFNKQRHANQPHDPSSARN
ncbi:MAG: DUF6152 family protein [Steroidobacteraceae bacterium]